MYRIFLFNGNVIFIFSINDKNIRHFQQYNRNFRIICKQVYYLLVLPPAWNYIQNHETIFQHLSLIISLFPFPGIHCQLQLTQYLPFYFIHPLLQSWLFHFVHYKQIHLLQ